MRKLLFPLHGSQVGERKIPEKNETIPATARNHHTLQREFGKVLEISQA
jgi:hypothetical protein